ncbi:MAG: M23 family metallopeptidase [Alcanivoracaceae bacterium]|jgi:murein DD-endopeptidase MepM/ murein hydrolase activator NlpD|nr:M23 family metallopeptidase [Alcanivoracaceae bacterium]
MNIIILNPRRGGSRTLHLPRWLGWAGALMLVVLPVSVGIGAYYISHYIHQPLFSADVAQRWHDDVRGQQEQLFVLQREADEEVRALTLRLADMQARLLRLDALGERLLDVAGIRADEFDFSSAPALGGPEALGDTSDLAYAPPAFVDALGELAATLERREEQLNILEGLMNNRRQEREASLSGRPVQRGWLSSRFGRRTDPFSGRLAQHKGVDFAGKEGTDVVATGAGVVTFSGERWGYGNMVEINHGNGLTTRYGHLRDFLVSTGDIVRAGEPVATLGSTGRSTGPHVHYEVLRHGQHINPEPFLHRPR